MEVSNPEYYRRMILGQWGSLEGLIYNLPLEQRKISNMPETEYVVCGVDFGFSHPSAYAVCALAGGAWYVMQEVYRYKMRQDDHLQVCKELLEKYNIATFYCDSADPGTIDFLLESGIPAQGAYKAKDSVSYGINCIQTLIGVKKMFVDESCTALLREFDSYIWNDKVRDVKEVPIKKNDHCLDALRYAMMSCNEGLASVEKRIAMYDIN